MKKILFLISISIIYFGCSQESSLSDVSLTDPSLITFECDFYMKKGEDNYQLIFVYLKDKNNNSIELKEGGVYINGIKMSLKKEIITNVPYYSGIEAIGQITFGTSYNVTVQLADGKTYQSTITVQGSDLYDFTVPSPHNKNNNMIISWLNIDPAKPLTLEMTRTYRESNDIKSDKVTVGLSQSNLNSGTYTVASSIFTARPNTTEVNFKLVSKFTGSINGSFRGGYIRSTQEISRRSTIE